MCSGGRGNRGQPQEEGLPGLRGPVCAGISSLYSKAETLSGQEGAFKGLSKASI